MYTIYIIAQRGQYLAWTHATDRRVRLLYIGRSVRSHISIQTVVNVLSNVCIYLCEMYLNTEKKLNKRLPLLLRDGFSREIIILIFLTYIIFLFIYNPHYITWFNDADKYQYSLTIS